MLEISQLQWTWLNVLLRMSSVELGEMLGGRQKKEVYQMEKDWWYSVCPQCGECTCPALALRLTLECLACNMESFLGKAVGGKHAGKDRWQEIGRIHICVLYLGQNPDLRWSTRPLVSIQVSDNKNQCLTFGSMSNKSFSMASIIFDFSSEVKLVLNSKSAGDMSRSLNPE